MSKPKMTACMSLVSRMDEQDQDMLLDRLALYQKDGIPAERAQVMAASDTLAELEAERKEFMVLLREQHPDLFLVKPEIKRSSQRDMFPGELATKRSTVDTDVQINSKGETLKGKNINSAGQQITATKQGLGNFWKWFGASAATNDDGKPLVLYHSTNADFNTFEPGRETINSTTFGDVETQRHGIFLTPDVKFSQEYLRQGEGQNVMQVYAALENPLDLREGIKGPDLDAIIAAHGDDGKLTHRDFSYVDPYETWTFFDDEFGARFVAAAKAAGFDGAIMLEAGPNENKPAITYVAFDPSQVKSATGNLGTFDATNPDIRKSERRSIPGFTSALAKGIEDMPTKAALAGAWQAQIKGLVNKGVVKADELEWSGLNDWLELQGQPQAVYEPGFGIIQEHKADDGSWQQVDDLAMYFKTEAEAQAAITDALQSRAAQDGQRDGTEGRVAVQAMAGDALNFGKTMTPKITKAQITEYLKANGVRVQEVVLGSAPFPSVADAIRYIAESAGESEDWVRETWGYQNERDYITLAASMVDDDGVDGKTKYERYTLPGGENYREVLLTLPGSTQDLSKLDRAMWALDGRIDDMERAGVADDDLRLIAASAEWKRLNAEREAAYQKAQTSRDYKSSHWDQPNVIAHIRLNDRTDAEGGKVLFVEELQSDWGQDGKKKGFIDPIAEADQKNAIAKRDEAKRIIVELQNKAITKWESLDHGSRGYRPTYIVPGQFSHYLDEVDKPRLWAAIRDTEVRIPAASGIVAAPFVTKTDGWLNLALKRVMIMAAEGGYDKVAFVNGEQSADRYDLSKQVDAVAWQKMPEGTYNIQAIKGEDEVVSKSGLSASDVADAIGKDAAEKISSSKEIYGTLRGLDLKVGGEGMKTFYDQIIPQAVKKLLPKVGGGQMGEVDVSGKKPPTFALKGYLPGERKPKYTAQPGFDVTPAMRDKVAGGLPLFSRRRSANEDGEDYTGAYETDLFGQALPEDDRARSGSGVDAATGGNLQPAAALRDTPAPQGEYFARTLVGSEVERKLGTDRILTPEQAAQATAYLYRSAVERLDGIITDIDGKPLAAVGGFKGALSQASVYPATIMAEAVRVPGAARIWFSHNHPSGTATLSRADENLNGTLTDVFLGSGIEPMGLLAVTGKRFAHVDPSGNVTSGDMLAPTASMTVPVIERELADSDFQPMLIDSPTAAKMAAKTFQAKGGDGLILLNAKNEVVGWVPISDLMRGRLRNTGGLNAIYRALSESNAGAAILVHRGSLDVNGGFGGSVTVGNNIAAALVKADVRPLDSINVATGASLAEQGGLIAAGPLFSRRRGWDGFPDAVVATPLSTQSKDASYQAAKSGDVAAAVKLVDRVLPADAANRVRAMIGNSQPIIAAVHAEESAGLNKIPLAIAAALGDRLNLEVDEDIIQFTRSRRTGSDGMARISVQPVFTGKVRAGADYLVVDDTLTQGGTLAQLKTYIEDNGGRVVGAFALGGKQYSAKLSLDDKTLSELRDKYGSIEDWWRNELGYGFHGLTESEARYILKSGLSPQSIRDRVAATRQASGIGADEGDQANLSASRRRQTETPQFKRWSKGLPVYESLEDSGNSRGVYKVYHATTSDFNEFVPGGLNPKDSGVAIWLSPSATYQAAVFRVGGEGRYKPGANVMPLYARLERPMVIDDLGMLEWARAAFNAGSEFPQIITPEVKKSITEEYDSIIFDGDALGWSKGLPDGGTSQEIIVFDPTQIKSATGNDGSFDPANPDITKSTGRTSTGADWDSPSASKFDDMVYKIQDKTVDLKRVVASIREASGALADDLDTYLQEELYHGRTAKRTEDFVNMELTPLIEEMGKEGLSIADVEEYLHARHAPEANKVIAQRNPGVQNLQDGGSGMSTQDALDYITTLPADLKLKLEAAAAKVDAIIAKTNQLYIDYELESKDKIDGWSKMFDHYIPLQREDKDGSPGLGQGFSIKGKEVKGRTGSTRKVVDILANIALRREKAIVRGEKNRVSQSLVGLAQANPNDDFWQVDIVPTERVFNPATGLVEDRMDPMYKSRDNAVIAKIKDANGIVREHAVVFNEDDPRALRMASALKNLDATALEGLMGVSAKISRYFASINTQWNPVFGVVNLVRDVQGALLNLSSTPLKGDEKKIAKYTASALKGVYFDARAARKGSTPSSAWSQLWDEFQSVGGQTGYRDLFANSAERAEAIQKALDPNAWMDSRLGKIFTAGGALKVPLSEAKKGAGWIFNWLSDYNLAMENGVRLAAYKAGLERGLSKEQAASAAKNLTVNFNRKGQASQQAGALYAFFNASVQGTARIFQTVFTMEPGKPKTIRLSPVGQKIVYGGMLLGSMQAMALAAAGFNDDDPPDFVRERSLIIPLFNKKYITIPMPLGYHVLPNLGRISTEFVLSGFKDPHKRALSVASLFADTFNPIGNAGLSMQTLTPTALDPLVALTENKDYTGKPIARESFNKAIPGFTLGRDTATTLAKLMSEGINTLSGGNKYTSGVFSPTPDQIDYLIGQVTGGVGRELSKVEQSVLSTARGEELPTYKIPLVGRFVGDAKSQASEGTAFYANAERLNRLETEIKGLQKDGKTAEASELRRSSSESYLITMANQAERQIQKLRTEKRELIKADAPREKVKAIEERVTEVMARLNRASEALKEKSQ